MKTSLKKIGASIFGTSLLACSLFISNASATDKIKLNNEVPTYLSVDAIRNRANNVGRYSKGEYYVYKEYKGYLNISKVRGQAGAWINPSDNFANDTKKYQTFVVVDPVNVRDRITNEVVTYKNKNEIVSGTVIGDWIHFTEGNKNLKLHVSFAKETKTKQNYIVQEAVNVRDSYTNEIVGVKYAGETIKGDLVDGWVIFEENGKILKLHESYTSKNNVVALKVISSVNVRDNNLNLVGYFTSGTTFYGYREGNYYVFNDNGIKKVWHSYVTEVNEDISETFTVNQLASNLERSSTFIGKTSSNTNKVNSIVSGLKSLLGIKYKWGGYTPHTGFDCSGLTSYVFREYAGISIPRTSRAQFNSGKYVSRDSIEAGDLLFFGSGSKVTHVGIYIGNNEMIHARDEGSDVETVNINRSWYVKNYKGAARYIK